MVTIDQIKNEKADYERRFARRQCELNKIAEMLSESPLLKNLDDDGCVLLEEYFRRNGFRVDSDLSDSEGQLYRTIRYTNKTSVFLALNGEARFCQDLSGDRILLVSFSFQIKQDPILLKWWQIRLRLSEFWMFRKLRKMFCDKK